MPTICRGDSLASRARGRFWVCRASRSFAYEPSRTGLADVRCRSLCEEVLQAQAGCVVDRQLVELGGRDPADVCRFVAAAKGAVDQAAPEADVELLTYLAVAVFDEVSRVL